MMKHLFAGLTLIAALGLGACTGSYIRPDVARTNEDGQTEYVTNADQLESGIIKAFPDIPIPASHRIDLQQSVIFTSPSNTMGKISLAGKGDVATKRPGLA